jgi:hypothetical protein
MESLQTISRPAPGKPDYFIQFSDRDVRGIPQGYRGVVVEKMGWKWVSCRLSATGKPLRCTGKCGMH